MKGNFLKLTGFIFAGVAAIAILSTQLAMAAPPSHACDIIMAKLAASGADANLITEILTRLGCI